MMFDFDGDVAVAAVVDDIHVVDVVDNGCLCCCWW